MERITIRVNNKQKARIVLTLLKTIGLIEDIQEESEDWKDSQILEGQTEDTDFFALAGIWADRDITHETLRKEAWPVRS